MNQANNNVDRNTLIQLLIDQARFNSDLLRVLQSLATAVSHTEAGLSAHTGLIKASASLDQVLDQIEKLTASTDGEGA